MHVKRIELGRVSSVVNSFGIPVGFLKEKLVLSRRKCSYKVNLSIFTDRDICIYYRSRDVIMENRLFSFLYDKCGDISITVIDISLSISENLDIIFIYLC